MRRYLALVSLFAMFALTVSCGGGGKASFQDVQLAAGSGTGGPSAGGSSGGTSNVGSLSGRVTSLSDGRAVSGATVALGSTPTTSDSKGSYSFSNMAPGVYTLSVSAAGYLPRSASVSIGAGATTTQDVQLSVAGVLAGTISSAGGSLIGGATVQFSGGALNETSMVPTDANGRYNTGWISIGTYSVTISASGYEANSATATVNTGQTTTANVTLASKAPGPQADWIVVTLPNPLVTPNWRNYAPADCQPDPTVCVNDQRFWEEFDFTHFSAAIDASFAAIAEQGKYHGVLTIMALADSATYWNNIRLMFNAAAAQGLAFEPVLFPKQEWGKEWCYLYPDNAPSVCEMVAGTTTAVAYQKMINLMNFVQGLGGACNAGSYNRSFAIWYGWQEFTPGYGALLNFWQSLPNDACRLRSAYVTWLDEPFLTNPDVAQLQSHVVNDLQLPFWIDTEMYLSTNLIQNHNRYAPYQTVITGYPGAGDVTTWAQGICGLWSSAEKPERLGVWTVSDRDVAPIEQYRAYINGSMANAGSICAE